MICCSLLTAADNQDFWVCCIDFLGTLTLPANSPGHVSIGRRELRELFELLGNGMHSIDLPSFLSEDSVNDGGSDDKLRLEGNDKLQLSKVGVRLNNSWCRSKKVEIESSGLREKVFGGLVNCWSEVECALIPGEG